MAENTIVANHRRLFECRVQDRVVLHARALTNSDFAVVAAQHGTRPYRTVRSDCHRADHHCIWVHIRVGMDGRNLIAEGIDGHGFQP